MVQWHKYPHQNSMRKLLIPLFALLLSVATLNVASAATRTTVDINNPVYNGTDTMIGASGFPQVAVSSAAGVELVTCTNSDCTASTTQLVHTYAGVNSPEGVKIIPGANEFPILVFFDYTNNTLYQLRCGNETCTTSTENTISTGVSLHLENIVLLPDNTIGALVDRAGVIAHLDLIYLHCADVTCTTVNTKSIFQSDGSSSNDNYYGGDSADLAVAPNGKLHMIYSQYEPKNKMWHVLCDNNDCSTSTVTLTKDEVAPYDEQTKVLPDLKITRNNLPRIAYQEYLDTADDLTYSTNPQVHVLFCTDETCTAAGVTDKNIENNFDLGDTLSMQLNSSDYPVLAYDYEWKGNATAMTNNESSFGLQITECMDTLCDKMQREMVIDPRVVNDLNDSGVEWVSLARDRNDNIFVSTEYHAGRTFNANRQIDVVYKPRSTVEYPTREQLFSQATYRPGIGAEVGYSGVGIQAVKGPDGFLRIAYYEFWEDTVRYVRCRNLECTERTQATIDGIGDSVNFATPTQGGYLSIAMGTDGLARIVYTRGGDGAEMALATCDNDDCYHATLKSLGAAGGGAKFKAVDLALDNANIPYIIYTRDTFTPGLNADEYFSYCSDAACTTLNSTLINTGRRISGSTAKGFNASNQFMFVYYDFTNGTTLRRCTAANCSTFVDTVIAAPFGTSTIYRAAEIRFGTDGFPRISYFDDDNYNARFIKCNDMDCTTKSDVMLPFSQDADYFNMELNSNDLPRFSGTTFPDPNYYGTLEYVYCTTQDCNGSAHQQTLRDGFSDGTDDSYWNDIVLTANDVPVIVNTTTLGDYRLQAGEVYRCFDYTCAPQHGPSAPTGLFSNNGTAQTGQTNPTNLSSLVTLFSALFQDNTVGATAGNYQLQISPDKWFNTLSYDSTKATLASSVAIGARSEDLGITPGLLNYDTQYYWRVRYWDNNDIVGLYSDSFSTPNTFTVVNSAPTAPTGLLANGQTNPSNLATTSVTFSALHHDPNGDDANKYRLEVATDNAFTSVVYDSGAAGTAMPSTADGARNTPDVAATGLTSNQTYYWRIKFWDASGSEGAFSATAQFTILAIDATPPAITAQTPANAATSQSVTPSFSYTIADADSNVDISTVNITVNGEAAITAGVCQAGYTCSTIPGGDAPSVTFAFTRNTAFANNLGVTVAITASDTAVAPNTLNASTGFTTVGGATPPAGGSGGGSGGGFSSAPNSLGSYLDQMQQEQIGSTNTNSASIPTISLDMPGSQENQSDTPSTPVRPSAPGTSLYPPAISLCEMQRLNLNKGTIISYDDIAQSDFRTLVRDYGIVLNGDNDPTNPFAFVSRSEMLRLILQTQCAAFTLPQSKDAPFPDVPKNHKDALYVAVAKAQDIVTGYLSDGTYKPDNDISRAEALKIVLEVLFRKQYPVIQGNDIAKVPSDVAKDAWYFRYANFAAERGILPDGAFRPNDKATREDIANFLLEAVRVMSLNNN